MFDDNDWKRVILPVSTHAKVKEFSDTNDVKIWQVIDNAVTSYLSKQES